MTSFVILRYKVPKNLFYFFVLSDALLFLIAEKVSKKASG